MYAIYIIYFKTAMRNAIMNLLKEKQSHNNAGLQIIFDCFTV